MADGVVDLDGRDDYRAVITHGNGVAATDLKRQLRRGAAGEFIGFLVIDRNKGHAVCRQDGVLDGSRLNNGLTVPLTVGVIFVLDGVVHLGRRNDHSAVVTHGDGIAAIDLERQLGWGAAGEFVGLLIKDRDAGHTVRRQDGAFGAGRRNGGLLILLAVGVVFMLYGVIHLGRRNNDGAVITQSENAAFSGSQAGGCCTGELVFVVIVRADRLQVGCKDLRTLRGSAVEGDGAVQNVIGVVFVADDIADIGRRNDHGAVITHGDGIAAIDLKRQIGGGAAGEFVGLLVIDRHKSYTVCRQDGALGGGGLDGGLAVLFAVGVVLVLYGVIHLDGRDIGAVIIQTHHVVACGGQSHLQTGGAVGERMVSIPGLVAGRISDPAMQLAGEPCVSVLQAVIGIITGFCRTLQVIANGIRNIGQIAADGGDVKGDLLFHAANEVGQRGGGIYSVGLGFDEAGRLYLQGDGIGHGIGASAGLGVHAGDDGGNIPCKAGGSPGDAGTFQIGHIAQLDVTAHRGRNSAGVGGCYQRRADALEQAAQLRHVLRGHVVLFVGGDGFHGVLGVFLAGLLVTAVAVQEYRIDLNAGVLRCLRLGDGRLAVVGVDAICHGGGPAVLTGDSQRGVMTVTGVVIVGATAYDGVVVKLSGNIAGFAAVFIPAVAASVAGAAGPVGSAGQTIAVSGHAVREEDDDLLRRAVVRSEDLLGGVNAGLHVGTAIVDVPHGGRGGGYGGLHLGDVTGQATMVPVSGTEAYHGDLVAGCSAGLIQNAGYELLYRGLRVGAAFAVHTVGAVDAQHDVSRAYRLYLHQIGGGDGHGHIEVVAAGMGGRLLDGNHVVLGRYKSALLHDLAVSCDGGSEGGVLYAAQEHAQEQKSGNGLLAGIGSLHDKYLRKHDEWPWLSALQVGAMRGNGAQSQSAPVAGEKAVQPVRASSWEPVWICLLQVSLCLQPVQRFV